VAQGATLGAYFVNWAQYRAAPYTYTASNLQSIIKRIDQIYYGFIYFCPPAGTNPMPYWSIPPYGNCTDANEYQLLSVEPKDATFLPQIVGMKSQNPNLKVLLSIGGWNFPSAFFSKLAANSTSRSKFVSSINSWLTQYKVDGVDIDWEYPGSPARTDPVEISCYQFDTVQDAGGSSNDKNNIAPFLQAIKQGMPAGKLLTFAAQAGKANENAENLAQTTQWVDMWHIMTYDYQVSDIPDSSGAMMSPNAPLYNPAQGLNESISSSVADYIAAGVPKSKIMAGIPYYGHTWYSKALIGTSNWQKFGNTGTIQGECCGPFVNTYGAKYGKGCNMCGTMMYSEVQAAQPTYYYDSTSQSAIGFWNTMGADGWTEPGTWISYNDPTSVAAITNWAKTQGLSGVFVFDTSMDSISGSTFTYDLTNKIADTLGGH
jgi:chitinase